VDTDRRQSLTARLVRRRLDRVTLIEGGRWRASVPEALKTVEREEHAISAAARCQLGNRKR